jgi:hypothetical protein
VAARSRCVARCGMVRPGGCVNAGAPARVLAMAPPMTGCMRRMMTAVALAIDTRPVLRRQVFRIGHRLG